MMQTVANANSCGRKFLDASGGRALSVAEGRRVEPQTPSFDSSQLIDSLLTPDGKTHPKIKAFLNSPMAETLGKNWRIVYARANGSTYDFKALLIPDRHTVVGLDLNSDWKIIVLTIITGKPTNLSNGQPGWLEQFKQISAEFDPKTREILPITMHGRIRETSYPK